MANRPGYFADWYKTNKAALSRRRKVRYHNDEEYRDAILVASRDYRKRVRSEKPDTLPSVGFPEPEAIKLEGGGEIVGFTIRALASYVGRGIQAVNAWHKRGVLPDTPYRDARGKRRYTIEQMEAVRRILGSKRQSYHLNAAVAEEIRMAWAGGGFAPKALGEPLMGQLPRSRSPRKIELRDGTIISLFTISGLGLYVNRSAQTLVEWEKRGMLPRTPYRDKSGRRYYTVQMMGAVREAIDGRERVFPLDPSMRSSVRDAWDDLGVPRREMRVGVT